MTADPATYALPVLHYQKGLVRDEDVVAVSGQAAPAEKHTPL